jgi:hypothetical protein
MSDLVLSHEQAKLLEEASAALPIRDPSGKLIGYASPNVSGQPPKLAFSPEQIAELEQRLDSDGPWSTTKEVIDRLRAASSQ